MAASAHDDRDYEFAKQFGIEIVQVIKSENDSDVKLPFCEKGKMINSVNLMDLSLMKANAVFLIN